MNLNLTNLSFCLLISTLVAILFVQIFTLQFVPKLDAQTATGNTKDKKVVILNFDDGRKSQFTEAKPILDKYGFKATFYVVCGYVGNKPGYMNWTEIKQLSAEGHDIESHTMNHRNLSDSSKKSLEFQIGESKACLQEHGIKATSFAYPFDQGSDNKTVVKVVSKYYDLARTASSPVTFLHCDGWIHQSHQNDCSTYTKDGKLNYANQYSIRGWSHDQSRKVNSFDDDALYNRFVQVVNSQTKYNNNGTINAIPIVIYHSSGDQEIDYSTNLDLFNKEMKYLHDGNFTVLTMANLGFDKNTNYLYIK